MGIEVREVTPADDASIDALVEVRVQSEGELNPGDPVPPRAEIVSDLFIPSVAKQSRAWVASVDGVPVGEIEVVFELTEGNETLGTVDWLATVPGRRREGVATALFDAALRAMREAGRTSVLVAIPRPAAREGSSKIATAWAERVGLSFRLEERASRLRVADLDRDAIDRWLAEGRSRTDGYRIVQFAGAIPETHLAALVDAQRAMADAPIDDLDWTPPHEDAAYLVGSEDARIERGLLTRRTLVLAPDGTGAGASELLFSAHRPPLAWQGDTGVAREHRGRGLGRWLKAENLTAVLTAHPEIASIETHNAESNPWMLDINVAMGFRPHVSWLMYQGDTETVARRLRR